MKLLVTGCSGFLGQHIIPALQDGGHYVVGVDKRPERNKCDYFILANVEDIGYRDLLGIDVVVHLAWRTNIPDCMRHPVESTKDNILMTTHLLERCKEAGVKHFIFPSTASLYSHNETPWTEDMKTAPMEPYSWQKSSCEELCQMNSANIVVTILRFFQVFGEFQREDTALSAFFRLKSEGKPITLTETTAQSAFRSGQRDFIYAGDLASAIALIVRQRAAGTYNVCTGKIHTMEEIAEAVGGTVEWIPRRPHEVERHLGDPTRLKALGWEPKVDVIQWIYEKEKMQNL